MRRSKTIVLIGLILLLSARPVRAVFVTDIIAYGKMALEYSKHLKSLKRILDVSKKLREDFEEFKGRFSKIHSGLKREALDVLLTFKDIEFYFNSPYVRNSKDEAWKEVWKDTKNLFKKLPYLNDQSILKESDLYRKNKEFRQRADFRIGRDEEIYKEYETVLNMISDTRQVITDSAEKYKSIEGLIRKFTTQRSTGKLIGLLCELKLEQLVKLDLLITSMRIKMELELKEQLIRMDMAKKREIEFHEDREKAKRFLREGQR